MHDPLAKGFATVPWVLNVIYLLILVIASPWLLFRRWRKGKKLGGLYAKLTGKVLHNRETFGRAGWHGQETGHSATPTLWLHAVSVGEVLLLQPIIQRLRLQFPEHQLVLSVSTTTGREVAEKTYPDITIIWYPFDFTWAVNRALDQVQPSLILLAELELWPNFITLAHRRNIPVIVVNGRISERSARGYRRLSWFLQPLWKKITCFAVQQEEYAQRLRDLGMPVERIVITGSVKFDGVTVNRHDPKVMQLRYDLQLETNHLVWVVGSTQAPEEAWALELFQKLQPDFPTLHLILVPRHAERFDEVCKLIEEQQLYYIRRSRLSQDSGLRTQHSSLILIDTLGELKAAWGLADVGFVGGSFNDRGGQNMIEPAAYGVAVTFGPNTWNFKQVVSLLLQEQAAIEVHSKEEWLAVTRRLLNDAAERAGMGARAQQLVASQQGATAKTMELLATFLPVRAQAA